MIVRPTIIILTWNASLFLPACLKTLLAQDYPAFSTVIVDNGSTDDTVALARSLHSPTAFPAVQIIENRANLGFAGGNNAALRQVESPFVVLLNPDVELAPNWLSELIAPMLADPGIGIAGCKIYEPDGLTLQHAGGYIMKPQALSGHYGLGERDVGQHNDIRDVEYVMGAAMAIRREVIQTVGLLDEGFFLYYEDVDYCERARKAGYRVAYIPGAHLLHNESSTTQRGSAFYFSHMHASRWRYMLKYYIADELVERTVPAETTWLAQRGHKERLGLQFAYRTAQRQLPFLWRRRTEYNAIDRAKAFDQVNAALARLRAALWGRSSGVD
jgi:GT2 family glycosyltransferase